MRSKRILALASIALMTIGGFMQNANAQAPTADKNAVKNVVLVHGAFADGSSWSKIIPLLEAKGLNVVAVQNPLSSFAEDVATAKRAIGNIGGPVLLVGHSYGGAVITEAGNDPKVVGLVYVAAFAPGDGEAVADLGKDLPPPPGMPEEKADAAGFISLTPKGVDEDFAQDLTPAERKLIWATQGPTAAAVFGTKITNAAWKSKPAWYVVATSDRMIQPKLQESMAAKIKAKKTIKLPTSHVPMLSRPADVAALIVEAAKGSAAK